MIRLQHEFATLQSLNFSSSELDLRNYFNNQQKQSELRDLLSAYGLIWVRGGNSFVLRRAMRMSNFDGLILDLLGRDAIVYGGYSAGIIMLTPTLRGIELVDDPNVIPTGYDPVIPWECLGLIPYAVVPHYKSGHPESAANDNLAQYYCNNNIPFKTLHDGEAIVINGERVEIGI